MAAAIGPPFILGHLPYLSLRGAGDRGRAASGGKFARKKKKTCKNSFFGGRKKNPAKYFPLLLNCKQWERAQRVEPGAPRSATTPAAAASVTHPLPFFAALLPCALSMRLCSRFLRALPLINTRCCCRRSRAPGNSTRRAARHTHNSPPAAPEPPPTQWGIRLAASYARRVAPGGGSINNPSPRRGARAPPYLHPNAASLGPRKAPALAPMSSRQRGRPSFPSAPARLP